MRTTIDPSIAVTLQHTIGGTGTFTGEEVGRPSRVIGTSTARVTIKAKSFGTSDNAFHTQFVDDGGVVQATRVVWVDRTHMRVHLRRNGAGILATAQEVADAINADGNLCADAGGTAVVAAAADAALTGGVDPTNVHMHYRIKPADNVDGGLFFIDATDSLDVLQIAGKFVLSGDEALKVEIVSLNDGLAPVEAEAFTIHTSTRTTASPSFVLSEQRTLGPHQAIRVTIDAPGVVQLTVRRTERPYLSA